VGVKGETEWLDDMINEAVTEDKNLTNKCCDIANGKCYQTLCLETFCFLV